MPPRAARVELAPVSLDRDELHYLAGLFDGEGSVCILKMKAPTKRRPTPVYNLRVGIQITDEPTARRFHELFGGMKVRAFTRGTNKVIYQWGASQWLGLRCLTALAPALRIKRQQADIAREYMTTYRHEGQGRNLLDAALFSERLRMIESMSALNDSHWRRKRQLNQ